MVFFPTRRITREMKSRTPELLLHPHPDPVEERQHVLSRKAIVWKLKPPLSLQARGLHSVAQVAGLVGPPVRESQPVLAEVVSQDEYQECR